MREGEKVRVRERGGERVEGGVVLRFSRFVAEEIKVRSTNKMERGYRTCPLGGL